MVVVGQFCILRLPSIDDELALVLCLWTCLFFCPQPTPAGWIVPPPLPLSLLCKYQDRKKLRERARTVAADIKYVRVESKGLLDVCSSRWYV